MVKHQLIRRVGQGSLTQHPFSEDVISLSARWGRGKPCLFGKGPRIGTLRMLIEGLKAYEFDTRRAWDSATEDH